MGRQRGQQQASSQRRVFQSVLTDRQPLDSEPQLRRGQRSGGASGCPSPATNPTCQARGACSRRCGRTRSKPDPSPVASHCGIGRLRGERRGPPAGAGADSRPARNSSSSCVSTTASITAVNPALATLFATEHALIKRRRSCRLTSGPGFQLPPSSSMFARPLTISCAMTSPSMCADRSSRSATSRDTVLFPAPGVPVIMRQPCTDHILAHWPPSANRFVSFDEKCR